MVAKHTAARVTQHGDEAARRSHAGPPLAQTPSTDRMVGDLVPLRRLQTRVGRSRGRLTSLSSGLRGHVHARSLDPRSVRKSDNHENLTIRCGICLMPPSGAVAAEQRSRLQCATRPRGLRPVRAKAGECQTSRGPWTTCAIAASAKPKKRVLEVELNTGVAMLRDDSMP